MNVQIVSIQAALHGRPSIIWIGDVKPSDLNIDPAALTHEAMQTEAMQVTVNEALFRYFNRVDEGDNDRLHDIGYDLPSLSVGDLLHWGGKTHRVAGIGFDQVTDSSDYALALTRYTLLSIGRDDEARRTEIERGI